MIVRAARRASEDSSVGRELASRHLAAALYRYTVVGAPIADLFHRFETSLACCSEI